MKCAKLGLVFPVFIIFHASASTAWAQRAATGIPTLVNGFVVSVTVTDGGSGYTSPPNVAITGGGGSGASGISVITNGLVTKIIMTDAGFGYTSPPLVVIDPPPGPSFDFANGLVAHYRFDGNATDESGNGYNGTITKGTFIPDRFGSPAGAIEFTNLPNGIAGVLTTNLQTLGNVFSLCVWFRCWPGVGGQLIAFGDGSKGLNNLSDRYIEFNGTTGIMDFYVYPGSRVYLSAANVVTDDRWHSAVATLSPAGMNLYLDGSKVATNPGVTSAYAYSGYWQVGSAIADIDDVRIYSRALSDSEVAALFVMESKATPYLKVQVKSVRLNLFLEVGKTNQLETTTDFVNWTAVGSPFISSTPTLYQDFDVLNGTNGFFRIREIP